MVRFALLILLAASLPGAGQVRRIYLAPDDHTDYMWSGDEDTYSRVFLEMLDYYLELADKTAGHPPEHQSRWNCDGTYWVWTYQRNRTGKEFARLVERIRDGHIGVPLNALVSCYGGMPTEAVLRGMYYAGTLERTYNLRFPLAVAMENQTLPYGLGALWAGSGARYSWKGICDCATRMENAQRPHEAYWWCGLDGSRLLMKWNTLLTDNKSVGGYAEAGSPERSITLVETDPRFTSRWPYPVAGVFGQGWDDLKTLNDEFVQVAREKTTPSRKVVVSNETDFFEEFERNHGRQLPEYAASFGNEWDLYSASMAEVSARVRRAVESLRAAEAMAVLVGLRQPSFLSRRKEAREQAWMNLGLYWEHNWTADGRVVTRQARAGWQRRLAGGIESYVNSLHNESAEALGGLISHTGSNPRFFVFNPLGWARSDAADLPYDGPADAHVFDLAIQRVVPSQIAVLSDPQHQRGLRHLRVWAADVPPVGYKVFEIRPGSGESFPPAADAGQGILENAAYRLRIEDRGAISSLIDKSRASREFARSTDGLWINDLGLGGGMLSVENVGPVSVALNARGFSPLPHTSRITLYRNSRRIDIDNEITRNFGTVEQWNFSFNLDAPDIWHEELGAILRARLLNEGGHYAPTNSRLD
jgi:alpha-mannosidase